MKQNELIEFNKRCSKILGYSNPISDRDFYFVEKDNDENSIFSKLIELNFEKRFYSDWNWIMEIVKLIQSKKVDFTINSLWNEFNQKSYTQVSVVKRVGEMSKDRKAIYNTVNVYEKNSSGFRTPEEAVVDAINKFLIWYEQNN